MVVPQLLHDRFLPNFFRNDGNVANNKNVQTANHENVGQSHRLQKSLYLGYDMIDFNQTFTKMIQLGLGTKASHQLTLKM